MGGGGESVAGNTTVRVRGGGGWKPGGTNAAVRGGSPQGRETLRTKWKGHGQEEEKTHFEVRVDVARGDHRAWERPSG